MCYEPLAINFHLRETPPRERKGRGRSDSRLARGWLLSPAALLRRRVLHGVALARCASAFSDAVTLQQRARVLGAHRLAEVEALRVFAAELIEFDGIGLGLHTFRHHFHPEVVRERHDRAQDRRPRALAVG